MIAWAAGESAAVTLRFLVYLDLLLLAGLSLCAGRTMPGEAPVYPIAWLAIAGAVLTLVQWLATALAMVGGNMALLDAEMLGFLAFETPMGISGVARLSLLAVLAMAVLGVRRARWLHGLLAVGAIATLAWSGHAGASEGVVGAIHRASDIVHLIAASAWLGMLALLLGAIFQRTSTPVLIAALRRFAGPGTLIVAALLVSGLINLWAIVGIGALPQLIASDYGRVLGLKLVLFTVMLGFAALNRWHLTPRLQGPSGAPARRLQNSVSLETGLAVGVILAVAALGTMSPTGTE